MFQKKTGKRSRHTPARGRLDPGRDLRPRGASLGSYLISVCGSASMEGGPLVRREGFTNTPWPGGQRKYTRSCTVPLCFPAEEFINLTFGILIQEDLVLIIKKTSKKIQVTILYLIFCTLKGVINLNLAF